MPLDHYLPATYLASFSEDQKKSSRRRRELIVGDLTQGRCFRSIAGNVGAEKDFYIEIVDNIWKGYETVLSNSISALIDGSITAKTWARVLVPFVAGLLVRGPDFNQRFEKRLEWLNKENLASNTNMARVLEFQRLLAPILTAKWKVLSAHSKGSIIINDIGFTPFVSIRTAEYGIAIPLGLRQVLVLIPFRNRVIAKLSEGSWIPVIQYGNLDADNHFALNKVLAESARRFIFGPNEQIIQQFIKVKREMNRVPEPEELGLISDRLAIVHEFTWHRLVAMLEKSPLEKAAWSFNLDWKAVSAGWAPPVYFPTNLPEFPSSLRRIQDSILVDLYDVQGFTE
jgi:hypothetical protein